jgi:glycerol-3-phosphate dehydrogenase
VTRDFRIYEHKNLGAPFLSIFGGKLTTYRVIAEKIVDMVGLEMEQPAEPWTAKEPLPGGDMAHGDLRVFMEKKGQQYDWLLPAMLRRYAHSYGTRMDRFLDGAKSLKDLGQYFGDDLYEAEVTYLVRNEWARTAEDILWRRTKIGLRASEQTIKNLEKALPKILEKALSP